MLPQAPTIGRMALPHWLTRVNLVLTNRLIGPFAGWLPWFGILEHTGRRSGTVRHTPINLFQHGDGFVIALTYGPDVQWLQNVEAAGRCRVRTRGRWIDLSAPRLFRDPGRRAMPLIVRPILAALRVSEFVELTAVG